MFQLFPVVYLAIYRTTPSMEATNEGSSFYTFSYVQ